MQGRNYHPPEGFRGANSGRGRSRTLAILLVLGLCLSGGAAGVLAGQSDGGSDQPSAAIAQYAVPPPAVAPEVVPPVPAPEVLPEVEEPEAEEPTPERRAATTPPAAAPVKQLPFTGTDILLYLALLGTLSLGAGLALRRRARHR